MKPIPVQSQKPRSDVFGPVFASRAHSEDIAPLKTARITRALFIAWSSKCTMVFGLDTGVNNMDAVYGFCVLTTAR